MLQSTLNETRRDAALNDPAKERTGIVLHQTSRLKHLTHRFLLLSRAEAGALPVKRERYDLSTDLEGLMEDAEALCQRAALTFEQQIEVGVFVEADGALMQLVFQILVSNAVKYNPAKWQRSGAVHQRWRGREIQNLKLQCRGDR